MGRLRTFLLPLGVFLIAGWIYWPAMHGGWIWDDRTEIDQIAVLHGAPALRMIWIAPHTGDYYPVKTTLEWLQWLEWGNHTFGYHLTNVFLHACSALLLWRLLRRLGVRWAGLGGLLFLVHPLAVESVAWVDELKNALSLPFLLLAMLAWLDFDNRRTATSYLRSLLFFLLAMLSKSSVVMFPCLLLLFTGWKRGRIRATDLRATAPFFGISAALGLVAIWFQRHHGFGGTLVIPFGGPLTRTALAGLVAAFYFSKGVFPVGLMPVYPRWQIDPASLVSYLPWLALLLGFGWLWTKRSTWGRDVLFGLGWFFLNLAPVLGFIPISHMRFTWAMDHLAYIPLVGLAGLAAAGFGALETRLGTPEPNGKPPLVRYGLGLGGAILCALLAVASHRYAAIFFSDETFWSYALAHNPAAWLADNNLGNIFLDRGEAQSAVPYYERALQLNPEYAEAEYNLGLACAQLGRLPEAIVHYTASLRLEPANEVAHNNLGNAYLRSGQPVDAIRQYGEAARLDPKDVLAQCNWAVALMRLGRPYEAITHYQAALQSQPNYVPAHLGLGSILAQTGQMAEALREFEIAARLAPNDPMAREYLQRAQASMGP
jgi:protein O-mannosyl-transferase